MLLLIALVLIHICIASSVQNTETQTRTVYVLNNERLFDKDEVNLILKFSTDKRPLNAIKISQLSQNPRQLEPLSRSIYIVPPFNIQSFRNDSSTFSSLGNIINEIYQELDASKATLRATKYAELR